jgi:hypothetical protein
MTINSAVIPEIMVTDMKNNVAAKNHGSPDAFIVVAAFNRRGS